MMPGEKLLKSRKHIFSTFRKTINLLRKKSSNSQEPVLLAVKKKNIESIEEEQFGQMSHNKR